MISVAMTELGKVGGKVRAERLSPERRREIATKASKVAAEARSKRVLDRQSDAASLPGTDVQITGCEAQARRRFPARHQHPSEAIDVNRPLGQVRSAAGALGTIEEFRLKRAISSI